MVDTLAIWNREVSYLYSSGAALSGCPLGSGSRVFVCLLVAKGSGTCVCRDGAHLHVEHSGDFGNSTPQYAPAYCMCPLRAASRAGCWNSQKFGQSASTVINNANSGEQPHWCYSWHCQMPVACYSLMGCWLVCARARARSDSDEGLLCSDSHTICHYYHWLCFRKRPCARGGDCSSRTRLTGPAYCSVRTAIAEYVCRRGPGVDRFLSKP